MSVEDRRHGKPRIDKLRGAHPAVAFLFVEPLLDDSGHLDLQKIHWVIVGDESGPGARPAESTLGNGLFYTTRPFRAPSLAKSRHGRRIGAKSAEKIAKVFNLGESPPA